MSCITFDSNIEGGDEKRNTQIHTLARHVSESGELQHHTQVDERLQRRSHSTASKSEKRGEGRERERSLAEGTKLIRPASVLPMRPLHATAAAANVAAVLNAVLPSPPSSSPSSAQSAAALPLQNQPCLRRLSVVMLVQIARRGTREGGRRILCGMHGRVQIKRSEEGLRKEKREGEMGLVCERASESATHMYAYVVHYLLQSADKIKRKASDRWTDADGPWTDRRTEQRVVTRGRDSGRERPREGE